MDIKKTIKESVEGLFLKDRIDKIKSISNLDELKREVEFITLGNHFPFNPPDPLRTLYRSKIEEILNLEKNQENKKILNKYLNCVKGEHKFNNLPPGAVY